MTFCKVCEVVDLGTVVVNGIEQCCHCGAANSVTDIEPSLWLEEIEACND